MKLKVALLVFVVLILGLFTSFSFTLIETSDRLGSGAKQLAAAGESIYVAKELKARLLVHNRNSFLFSLHRDPVYLESRRSQRAEILAILSAMDQLVNSESEEKLADSVKNQIWSYLNRRDQLNEMDLTPLEQYNQIRRDVDEALAVIDELIEINLTQMQELEEKVSKQSETAEFLALMLLSLGCIVVLGVIFFLVFFVARPLTRLSRVIARYGAGETPARTEVSGLHEIQNIGENFNSMADRLEERRQEQIKFLSAIAHDLRNPLGSMSMASELLISSRGEDCLELSSLINRQVKNLDRLVGDLLDTTRIEAGQLELRPGSQDICSLICDSVELHKMGSHIHRFEVQGPSEPLYCWCDGSRVSQVINNLLSNAMKYSPSGGSIKVRIWEDSERVWVSVSDRGIGIAPEDIENVFVPFRRTKATKETIPGVGLGLSTSRRIIEAHDGQLKVESRPGAGSTFTFSLPIHAQ